MLRTRFLAVIAPITFIITLSSISLSAVSQFSVGLEGGYVRNYIVTNNANRAFTYYQPLSSFSIAVPVQYTITDWFAVAADPGFVKKNYRQQRGDFYVGVYQDNDNNYIQLPLMGHFTFGGKRLKGFLNAGIYVAYWVSGSVRGTMANILNQVDNASQGSSVYDYEQPYNFNEPYAFNSIKDNRFEAGWVGGVGLEYNLKSRIKIFTEGRLLYSITDQQRNYSINQVPRYNNSLCINAGAMIALKK